MQMDGVASGGPATDGSGGQVMVLATTNCPWDLDDAIRRRLEKRVYVPLPDLASRNDIFAINLSGMRLASDVRALDLADRTDGYSGADINLVCREASMMPMRRLIVDKSPEEIQLMHSEGLLQAPTVFMSDFAEVSAFSSASQPLPLESDRSYSAGDAFSFYFNTSLFHIDYYRRFKIPAHRSAKLTSVGSKPGTPPLVQDSSATMLLRVLLWLKPRRILPLDVA